MFLEVFEIPKNFFQKVLGWGPGVKPLADKLQFESHLNSYNAQPRNRFFCENYIGISYEKTHISWNRPLKMRRDYVILLS